MNQIRSRKDKHSGLDSQWNTACNVIILCRCLLCQVPHLFYTFMTPLCWLDPRHVPAVCHVGFSTNLPAATAAALVVPLPNIRQRSPDFYSSSSKKTPPMKLQFASAVFWERLCHYCKTVINIWPESGSGLVLQGPLEYIHTSPLKVSGNPVKTLMPIKTGWCWVSNFCLIPFPDPIMVHAIAEKTKNKKKNPAEGW